MFPLHELQTGGAEEGEMSYLTKSRFHCKVLDNAEAGANVAGANLNEIRYGSIVRCKLEILI